VSVSASVYARARARAITLVTKGGEDAQDACRSLSAVELLIIGRFCGK